MPVIQSTDPQYKFEYIVAGTDSARRNSLKGDGPISVDVAHIFHIKIPTDAVLREPCNPLQEGTAYRDFRVGGVRALTSPALSAVAAVLREKSCLVGAAVFTLITIGY